MKVLFINTTCGIGSHGRICGELAEEYERQGYECKIAYGRGCSEKYARFGRQIGNKFSIYSHVLETRLFDRHGLGSVQATKAFLKWAEEYNPDLLWLHNIHGYYINYELLFQWIKSRPQMKVKWTLHDCWAFTGHCGYFTLAQCSKWRTKCEHCPTKRDYPCSIILDNSKDNYQRKKASFTGVKELTIITPSQWLADLVKESFLSEYSIEVHYNTIDTSVFKPTTSNFRKEYGIEDKFVILGVANVWHRRKGLDDFIELAKMLDDDFVIVLVGLTDKQIKKLPKKVLGLERTNTAEELAEIYTMSDVYVNPSREETFGMTTIEAESCGTPAIVYKETACEEVVRKMGGVAIPQNINKLYEEIVSMHSKKPGGTGAYLILLPKTSSVTELAGLYSIADVFVNPTHEDNYPTTNLEAQACGTYVITYDVGGSKETIK